ncbi:MAG: class I SAM-dependent RNA methyltransferase [Pseudobdellovibrionaceae bacterium]
MSSTPEKKPRLQDFVNQKYEVFIESLAQGGAGVGRIQGITCFVSNAAPGDTLLVLIIEAAKNYLIGTLQSIIVASEHRRTPPCPVAFECGGCSWQHITETQQLKQKENILKETLFRIGKLEPDFQILPIISSPQNFRYRNRIQLQSDGNQIGFFAKKSHSLVAIQDCLLAEQVLVDQFPDILSAVQKKNFKGRIELRLNKQSEVHFSLLDGPDDSEGFSQVNQSVNQKMVDWVVAATKDMQFSHIYDLYCGSGNFTFPLAQQFPQTQIHGVELSSNLINLAQDKVQNRKNIQFFVSDVEHFLKRVIFQSSTLVLLDPPRSGCSEKTLLFLLDLQPRHIIYISCHPVTLSRDLKILSPFYKIQQVQPFDMFPQTDHLETVCILNHRTIDT